LKTKKSPSDILVIGGGGASVMVILLASLGEAGVILVSKENSSESGATIMSG
jgi:succinate dehydrogenase/fumarate reductase flavoprotein subunit